MLTDAPVMLNVDCDMFANNPQAALHAMCLLLGFDDEVHSGFAQAPQKFHGALKDDPFGNQMEVFYEVLYGSCHCHNITNTISFPEFFSRIRAQHIIVLRRRKNWYSVRLQPKWNGLQMDTSRQAG